MWSSLALWIEGKGGRKRRDYGVEFWSEGGREGGRNEKGRGGEPHLFPREEGEGVEGAELQGDHLKR